MKYSKITPLIKKHKQLAIHTPESGKQGLKRVAEAIKAAGDNI